jgi:hypothetical protein
VEALSASPPLTGQVAIWLGSNLLSLTSAAIVFLAWHLWSRRMLKKKVMSRELSFYSFAESRPS